MGLFDFIPKQVLDAAAGAGNAAAGVGQAAAGAAQGVVAIAAGAAQGATGIIVSQGQSVINNSQAAIDQANRAAQDAINQAARALAQQQQIQAAREAADRAAAFARAEAARVAQVTRDAATRAAQEVARQQAIKDAQAQAARLEAAARAAMTATQNAPQAIVNVIKSNPIIQPATTAPIVSPNILQSIPTQAQNTLQQAQNTLQQGQNIVNNFIDTQKNIAAPIVVAATKVVASIPAAIITPIVKLPVAYTDMREEVKRYNPFIVTAAPTGTNATVRLRDGSTPVAAPRVEAKPPTPIEFFGLPTAVRTIKDTAGFFNDKIVQPAIGEIKEHGVDMLQDSTRKTLTASVVFAPLALASDTAFSQAKGKPTEAPLYDFNLAVMKIFAPEVAAKYDAINQKISGNAPPVPPKAPDKDVMTTAQYTAAVAAYQKELVTYNSDIEKYKVSEKDYSGKVSLYQKDLAAYSADVDRYKTILSNFDTKVNSYQADLSSYGKAVDKFKAGGSTDQTEYDRLVTWGKALDTTRAGLVQPDNSTYEKLVSRGAALDTRQASLASVNNSDYNKLISRGTALDATQQKLVDQSGKIVDPASASLPSWLAFAGPSVDTAVPAVEGVMSLWKPLNRAIAPYSTDQLGIGRALEKMPDVNLQKFKIPGASLNKDLSDAAYINAGIDIVEPVINFSMGFAEHQFNNPLELPLFIVGGGALKAVEVAGASGIAKMAMSNPGVIKTIGRAASTPLAIDLFKAGQITVGGYFAAMEGQRILAAPTPREAGKVSAEVVNAFGGFGIGMDMYKVPKVSNPYEGITFFGQKPATGPLTRAYQTTTVKIAQGELSLRGKGEAADVLGKAYKVYDKIRDTQPYKAQAKQELWNLEDMSYEHKVALDKIFFKEPHLAYGSGMEEAQSVPKALMPKGSLGITPSADFDVMANSKSVMKQLAEIPGAIKTTVDVPLVNGGTEKLITNVKLGGYDFAIDVHEIPTSMIKLPGEVAPRVPGKPYVNEGELWTFKILGDPFYVNPRLNQVTLKGKDGYEGIYNFEHTDVQLTKQMQMLRDNLIKATGKDPVGSVRFEKDTIRLLSRMEDAIQTERLRVDITPKQAKAMQQAAKNLAKLKNTEVLYQPEFSHVTSEEEFIAAIRAEREFTRVTPAREKILHAAELSREPLGIKIKEFRVGVNDKLRVKLGYLQEIAADNLDMGLNIVGKPNLVPKYLGMKESDIAWDEFIGTTDVEKLATYRTNLDDLKFKLDVQAESAQRAPSFADLEAEIATKTAAFKKDPTIIKQRELEVLKTEYQAIKDNPTSPTSRSVTNIREKNIRATEKKIADLQQLITRQEARAKVAYKDPLNPTTAENVEGWLGSKPGQRKSLADYQPDKPLTPQEKIAKFKAEQGIQTSSADEYLADVRAAQARASGVAEVKPPAAAEKVVGTKPTPKPETAEAKAAREMWEELGITSKEDILGEKGAKIAQDWQKQYEQEFTDFAHGRRDNVGYEPGLLVGEPPAPGKLAIAAKRKSSSPADLLAQMNKDQEARLSSMRARVEKPAIETAKTKVPEMTHAEKLAKLNMELKAQGRLPVETPKVVGPADELAALRGPTEKVVIKTKAQIKAETDKATKEVARAAVQQRLAKFEKVPQKEIDAVLYPKERAESFITQAQKRPTTPGKVGYTREDVMQRIVDNQPLSRKQIDRVLLPGETTAELSMKAHTTLTRKAPSSVVTLDAEGYVTYARSQPGDYIEPTKPRITVKTEKGTATWVEMNTPKIEMPTMDLPTKPIEVAPGKVKVVVKQKPYDMFGNRVEIKYEPHPRAVAAKKLLAGDEIGLDELNAVLFKGETPQQFITAHNKQTKLSARVAAQQAADKTLSVRAKKAAAKVKEALTPKKTVDFTTTNKVPDFNRPSGTKRTVRIGSPKQAQQGLNLGTLLRGAVGTAASVARTKVEDTFGKIPYAAKKAPGKTTGSPKTAGAKKVGQTYTTPKPEKVDQTYTTPKPEKVDQIYTTPKPEKVDQTYVGPQKTDKIIKYAEPTKPDKVPYVVPVKFEIPYATPPDKARAPSPPAPPKIEKPYNPPPPREKPPYIPWVDRPGSPVPFGLPKGQPPVGGGTVTKRARGNTKFVETSAIATPEQMIAGLNAAAQGSLKAFSQGTGTFNSVKGSKFEPRGQTKAVVGVKPQTRTVEVLKTQTKAVRVPKIPKGTKNTPGDLPVLGELLKMPKSYRI